MAESMAGGRCPQELSKGRRQPNIQSTVGILLVVVLLYPTVVSLSSATDLSLASRDAGDGQQANGVFLGVAKAKAMLAKRRVKRGWSINSLNLLWEMEEEQRRGAARAHQRALQLAKVCPSTCWGHFGPWSTCSATCGSSGVQSSHRNMAPSSECVTWVKKHGCPGAKVQTRPCNRSCHNGGTLRANDCQCTPAFNGTCCEKFVSCGDPGAPDNGYVENFDFTYGQNVTYSCRHGYRLRGDGSRTCESSGIWSGAVPYCAIVMCVRPPRLENGWIELPTGSSFTSKAEHGCVTGYYLRGVKSRVCEADGNWSGTEPSCKAVRCQRPLPPTGGSVRVSRVRGGHVTYGSLAVYSCDTGRVLQGPRVRHCGATRHVGIWTDHRPLCLPKKFCPVPEAPPHSGLHCSADVSKDGERCYVHCHLGFAHASPEDNYIVCSGRSNWTWTSQNGSNPFCLEVFTPEVSIQATTTYGVQDCSVLSPRESVILQAEFSQILGAQKICHEDVTAPVGCKISQVVTRCGDWRLQTFPSKLVSQEVIVTFNLTTEHKSLTKVDCNALCPNETDNCDVEKCLASYIKEATTALLQNVQSLHALFSEEGGKDAKYIPPGDTYSLRTTLAVGRMILLPKGNVKVSSIVRVCEQSTVASRAVCSL